MQNDTWIQVLMRALPAAIVFILGFVAASDKNTRARWGNLLYQVGSIRPDQREDAKIGSGVKWPFFVVALALLIWPFNYYRVATRRFEVKSDIYAKPPAKPTIYDQGTANTATNSATTDTTTGAPAGSQPAGTSPSASNAVTPSSTPAQSTNIYGQTR